MENCTYFFVEHDVTDRQGWDKLRTSWYDIFGAEDMTVDKARSYPEWEGNECVLSIPTIDDKMAMALWKMRSGTSKDEFQAFIDRFVCGYANNKVFQVEHAIGIRKLDARGFFSDLINAAQGRQSPGYLDAPKVWLTHHCILDREGFSALNASIADKINKICTTPSDCQTIFPAGHKCCLTLFFTGNDMVCFESTPEGVTYDDVRKAEDEFTRGMSRNYVYQMDTAKGINAFHLSEDNWSQDAMTWANATVKTAPVDSTTATMTTPVGIEASQ
mmetsp:Transcript_17787/g.26985  ORF Transcript_17787/g.26985 Transcript_17787/m.26985 type:complete len:273 (-) Transcript_17787:188-1006(-)